MEQIGKSWCKLEIRGANCKIEEQMLCKIVEQLFYKVADLGHRGHMYNKGKQLKTIFISRRRRRPGDVRYCNAPRPSIRPSVCLSPGSVCPSRLLYFLETLQVCAPSHGGVLYSF